MSVSSVNQNNQLLQMLYQSQLNSTSTTSSQSTQGTQATTTSPFDQIMQSLGTDLQSNNLQSAQQDFAQLQQMLQGANSSTSQAQTHHHHHHRATGSYQANAGTTGQSTQAVSSTTQGQASTTA